jgi:hypothetical protein
MFENVGPKIKVVSMTFAILGIISSFVGGGAIIGNGKIGLGVVIIVIGSLLSWIGSLAMIGLAEIIENTYETKEYTKLIAMQQTGLSEKEVEDWCNGYEVDDE